MRGSALLSARAGGCLLCAEAFASSKQKGRSNAEAWADCYESLDRGFLAHANAQPDADVARALCG